MYRAYIENYAPETLGCVGRVKDVRFEGQFLACMKMDYEVGGLHLTIYHIIVRGGA